LLPTQIEQGRITYEQMKPPMLYDDMERTQRIIEVEKMSGLQK
jgi:hypothetical protein